MMRIYLQCNLRILVRTFVFSVSVSFYDQTLESLHKGIHPELKCRQEEQLQKNCADSSSYNRFFAFVIT